MTKLNYFCVVDGQQEEIYLNRLAKLLTDFPKRTVTFNTIINNAEQLRRENYIEYDSVCLFDHDFKKTEFERSIMTCVELNAKRSVGTKRNPGSRVYHAYSNICFDLWLALHKEFIGRSAQCSPKEYISDVIRLYNLPKDSDIKQKKIIERIVKQIELKDVKMAISNAQRIRNSKLEKDKCVISVEGDIFYYPDPDFSIDIFIKQVIEKLGISI